MLEAVHTVDIRKGLSSVRNQLHLDSLYLLKHLNNEFTRHPIDTRYNQISRRKKHVADFKADKKKRQTKMRVNKIINITLLKLDKV